MDLPKEHPSCTRGSYHRAIPALRSAERKKLCAALGFASAEPKGKGNQRKNINGAGTPEKKPEGQEHPRETRGAGTPETNPKGQEDPRETQQLLVFALRLELFSTRPAFSTPLFSTDLSKFGEGQPSIDKLRPFQATNGGPMATKAYGSFLGGSPL